MNLWQWTTVVAHLNEHFVSECYTRLTMTTTLVIASGESSFFCHNTKHKLDVNKIAKVDGKINQVNLSTAIF